MNATERGLTALTGYEGRRRAGGIEAYLEFCAAAREFATQHGLEPQEIDLVLSEAARLQGEDARIDSTREEPHLFVVPASNIEAREHIARTLERPVDSNLLARYVTEETVQSVREQSEDNQLYVWGCTAGPKNVRTWEALQPGDFVAFYQNGRYTLLSQVIRKERNAGLAEELWGRDQEDSTFELTYFLQPPNQISIPSAALDKYLPRMFRGFMEITDQRVEAIEADFGSLEQFINERLLTDATGTISVQEAFEAVLRQYMETRLKEPFGRSSAVWAVFQSLGDRISAFASVRRRPTLKVTWSVGQGVWAKVPWVSLLDERVTQSTRHGVYAVFLFCQDMSGVYLTLAQGVVEPRRRLGARQGREYLRNNAEQLRRRYPQLAEYGFAVDDEIDLRADPGLGADYEDSTIAYKFYPAGGVPNDRDLEGDLANLLSIYEDYAQNPEPIAVPAKPPERVPITDLEQVATDFAQALAESHVVFGSEHEAQIRRFIASLATKRFGILTGLSGSGKTQLAIRFGEWLGEDRLHLEPVRPDWTGSEALFGFEDALQPAVGGRRAWHVPKVLEFMLRVAIDPQHPYLLVLDEMNLAHVERYFADVLSGIESGYPVLPNLQPEDDGAWRIPEGAEDRIAVPRNLLIVGTVNVDETTYMFSPKVLDRANVFEFRVRTEDLATDYRRPVSCRAGDDAHVRGFLAILGDDNWHLDHPHPEVDQFAAALRNIHTLLANAGLEFGHRVFYEAIRFAAMLNGSGDADWLHALDAQVLQKVLPRLHGSRRRLEPTLLALGRYALDLTSEGTATPDGASFDPLIFPPASAKLPLSFGKLQRMIRNLRANQFTSFTE